MSKDNKRLRAPRAKHDMRAAILYNVVLPLWINNFRHVYSVGDFREMGR